MPQKIKNLTNNFIDFVFSNWIKIAIVVSTLAWLFLFGHVFGINQQIWNFLNSDWESIINNKSNIITLVLAIGSTISAIFAVVISVRANRISTIALEVERPVILPSYNPPDEGKDYLIGIKNIGNVEAVDIKIYGIINKNDNYLLNDKPIQLLPNVDPIEIKFNQDTNSFIITYLNLVTNKKYKQGFDIDSGDNKVKNFGYYNKEVDFEFYQYFTLNDH